MASYEVNVKPDVLVWARESSGSRGKTLRRSFRSHPLIFGIWRKASAIYPSRNFAEIAEVYNRPLLAFFLDEPPKEEDALPDFRVLPENRGGSWSPELHKAYRRVAGQRQVLTAIAEQTGNQFAAIDFSLTPNEDAESAARRLREWLNAPSARVRSRAPYENFNLWVSLVEEKNILVTQVTGVELDEMRGFSIGLHPFPAIAINGKDIVQAKLFLLCMS